MYKINMSHLGNHKNITPVMNPHQKHIFHIFHDSYSMCTKKNRPLKKHVFADNSRTWRDRVLRVLPFESLWNFIFFTYFLKILHTRMCTRECQTHKKLVTQNSCFSLNFEVFSHISRKNLNKKYFFFQKRIQNSFLILVHVLLHF